MKCRKSVLRHTGRALPLSCLLVVPAIALAAGAEPPGPAAKEAQTAAAANDLVVALREIPVWEVHERVRDAFLYGQPSPSLPEKDRNTRYPALRSRAPVYGQVEFARSIAHIGGSPDNAGGILFFVLDQSEANSRRYDLLYFDENADRDLTNDKPRRPLTDVPKGLSLQDGPPVESTWFEPVHVTLGAAGVDRRTIELLPCVWQREDRRPFLRFVPAQVHTGRFEVDGKSFEAFLGYEYEITASFGESSSILCLVAQDGRRASYTNTEQFNVMPWLAGRYYRFSCTPTGDKLFAHAYDGPLGVLELGAGNQDTRQLQMMGQLCSQGSIVAIGYPLDEKGRPQGTARCEIPAGDYYPRYMNASLGKIGFTFSDNYYSDGPSRTRRAERPVHSIKIRRDKPYVLDFSNKPVVTFLRPARNEPLFLGQEMRVEAVLVDPVLNIMIRGLNDLTRTEKRTYKTPDGQEHSSDWSPSLDPKVTIARADGQIIAEGTMPFG